MNYNTVIMLHPTDQAGMKKSEDKVEIIDALNGFMDAGETWDFERYKTFITEDAVLWRNFDPVERNILQEVIDNLLMLKEMTRDLKYIDRRIDLLPDGAAMRWVQIRTTKDGKTLKIYSMGRFYTSDDGRITRLEQYIDSAQAYSIIGASKESGYI